MKSYFRPSQALGVRVAGSSGVRRADEAEMAERVARMEALMAGGRDLYTGKPLSGLDALQWLRHMSERTDGGEAHLDIGDTEELVADGWAL
jgi:hypothetical protein